MAYCENCGNELPNQAVVCLNCGHPRPGASVPGAMGSAVGAPPRTEGLAIASLILGIAGFVICPLVTSILAIVFGNQAKRKIEADPSLEGEGLAKAGVILGWIGIGIAALIFVIFVIAAISGLFTMTDFGPGF